MTKSERATQLIALKVLTRTSRQLKPKLKPQQNRAKVSKLKLKVSWDCFDYKQILTLNRTTSCS